MTPSAIPRSGVFHTGNRGLLRTVIVALTLGGVGFGLAACGSSSNALGTQACVHVQRSLNLFRQSLSASGSKSLSLSTQASTELTNALRPASLAANSDGGWQALAATLSESTRVPEVNLVHALTDECASSPAGPRS
ncbi:MAG TPA: hypothetical protein VG368_07475 [Acidimicrobiales bacterium]|nr:hypothetical protein [Acidimicrobiales bacterium]